MSFVNQLNLTTEEKKVYELLLSFGKLTIAEISNYAKLPYASVQQALESLIEKKAAGLSEGHIKKYFARIPLDYLTETSEHISEQISKYLSETNEKITEFKTALQSKKTEIFNQIQAEVSQFQNKLEQIVQETKDTTGNSIKSVTTEIQNRSDELSSKLQTTVEQTTTEISTLLKEQSNKLKENLAESQNDIDTTIKLLIEQNDQTIAEYQQKIQDGIQQKGVLLKNIVEPVEPTIQEIQSAFIEKTDEIISLFEQNIDISKLDMRDYVKNQTDKYLVFSQNMVQKTEGTIETANNTISQNLQELSNKLDTIISTKSSAMLSQIQEVLAALGQKLTQIKEEMTQELTKQKDNTIIAMLNKIKDESAIKFTALQNDEQEQRNNIVSERDMFLQKLEAKHQQTLSSYKETIEKTKAIFQEKITEFSNNVHTQLQEITLQLNKLLEQQQEDQINLFKQFQETLKEKLTASGSELENKFTKINTDLEALLITGETKLQSNKDQSMQNIQEIMTQVIKTTNDQLEDLLKKLNELSNSVKDKGNQILLEVMETVSKGLENEIMEVTKYIEGTQQSITDEGKQLISITHQLKEEFQTIEGTTKDMPMPNIKTATIIGKEAIQQHIEEIVMRTKRRVTIVVPQIDYVPITAISKLSTAIKVNVVFGKEIDISDPRLKEITNVNANVEVLAPRSLGAQELTLYIGTERDNEEILIGSVDEATNEIVAITSESTYFAEVLSKLILSDATRGKERLRF